MSDTAPSPLLLPANEHKQLVVIDFEYSSANTPGLEFANHFTEWCYNYHGEVPWQCSTQNYPTRDEQERFIRAYVNHRPQFHPTASATPMLDGKEGAPGSISAFMLDARGSASTDAIDTKSYAQDEARREEDVKQQVEQLMEETLDWRLGNSALWVSWGIVQAQIPELEAAETSVVDSMSTGEAGATTNESQDASNEDSVAAVKGDDEEFDYLSYAQDRAMFFWGDAVRMGFVARDDLPANVQARMKILAY